LALLGLIGCNGDDQHPVANATTAGAVAYVREVGADDPRGHWRLDGGADAIHPGAIEGDPDGATAFDGRTSRRLVGAGDLGGPEFTVELWEKDAKGSLLSYATTEGAEAVAVSIEADLSITVLGETVRVGAALPAQAGTISP